ncbi:helix-turn-helix domain-containing protein [Alsobacter sp. R-9]
MTRTDHGGSTAPDTPARALTAADLAAVLQVSVRTVRRMIAAGEVRVIRFGRSVRVPADEVARLLGGK